MTYTYRCQECDATWPSQLAALGCAERDREEANDRKHGRFYGINRSED